jgi:cytochrome c553
MVAAMEAHYAAVILAHDALMQGDLDAFHARLVDLETHELPPNSPDEWAPFDDRLLAAAGQAGKATDLTTAANALASVALACGTCHQSLGRGPVYPVPLVDEQIKPLKAGMREHQWATQMLWNGVTGPSDYAWDRGSEKLAETRIFADGEWVGQVDVSLLQRDEALRGLGEEARATTGLPARAMLYGRMLATCGGCHQAVGV